MGYADFSREEFFIVAFALKSLAKYRRIAESLFDQKIDQRVDCFTTL